VSVTFSGPQLVNVGLQGRGIHLPQGDRGFVEQTAIPCFALAQGIFDFFSLGDVTENDQGNRLSVDLNDLSEALEEDSASVGTQYRDFSRLPRRLVSGDIIEHLFDIILGSGRRELHIGKADDFLVRHRDQLGCGWVCVKDFAGLGVGENDRIQRAFEDGPEPLFPLSQCLFDPVPKADLLPESSVRIFQFGGPLRHEALERILVFPQGFFRSLLLRGVKEEPPQANELAIDEDGCRSQQDRKGAPIFSLCRVLRRADLFAPKQPPDILCGPFPVSRDQQVGGLKPFRQVFLRVSCKLDGFSIDKRDRAGCIHAEKDYGQQLCELPDSLRLESEFL